MRNCILRDRSFEPQISVGALLKCDDFVGEIAGWLTVAPYCRSDFIFHVKPEQVLLLTDLFTRQPVEEFWAVAMQDKRRSFVWVADTFGGVGDQPFRFESEGELQHFINLGKIDTGTIFWTGKFLQRKL